MRAGNITEECIFNDISSHNKFFLCSLKLSRLQKLAWSWGGNTLINLDT